MFLAVVNYAYHPILGRMLTVEEYGETQAIVSLFLNIGIIGGVFVAVMNNVAAKYREENPGGVLYCMQRLHRCWYRISATSSAPSFV